MFDTAGLDYPTSDWSFEDMRTNAIQLTLDNNGNKPVDADFDPENIVQWGWNVSISHLWQNHYVQAHGSNWCLNELCTQMDFVSSQAAVQWWVDLVVADHAAPYDAYSGAQTGIPGDPFVNGFAAMGFNGTFAIGQLNSSGMINYGITEPFLASDDERYTPISVTGYMISNESDYPDEAWELIEILLTDEFLANTWGQPGHGIPALRTASNSAINPQQPPDNQEIIVQALEYAAPFRPYGLDSFQAFGASTDLFVGMTSGEVAVEEALTTIEQRVNEILRSE
jgi:multiple sugar transport system substrate-binding protein